MPRQGDRRGDCRAPRLIFVSSKLMRYEKKSLPASRVDWRGGISLDLYIDLRSYTCRLRVVPGLNS